MQVRLIVFPGDDGLNVVVWGKWTEGSMRIRHFDTRTAMISTLLDLGVIHPNDAVELENATFVNSCPLYSSEIEEEILEQNGFDLA